MNVLGRFGGYCIVAAIAVSAGLGCGPATPDAKTAPPADTAAATVAPAGTGAAAAAPDKAPEADTVGWNKMSHEQKMSHMKTVIMPKMAALFQGFNATQYKDMNCGTCHGPGAKQGKFAMPTDSIVKLNPADHFAKHMGKTAEATKFMMAKVVPEMAKLQGEAPYDPATQKGFGCFECHMMEK
ncbi:MAG: hypothetical protein ABJE95_24495 [Byssovorax sp.]